MSSTCYSLYRGQSDSGIAEGPGTSVRRGGEQYIAGDPALAEDAQLLHCIRHWMTLEATDGDVGRLHNELESWSCFPFGDYYFVVRLCSAGTYDRYTSNRMAYFAHARAWALDSVGASFDPGLYLGVSDAFDAPWRGLRPTSTPMVPPYPMPDAGLLGDNEEMARVLLGFLFQQMIVGHPLILAMPLAEFSRAGRIHALVSFARAALPTRLRRRCRIRVFTRNPQAFLLRRDRGFTDGVDLLVIPEDMSRVAVSCTADPTRLVLLDSRGRASGSQTLAVAFSNYARDVIDSARRIPASLTAFTARFDGAWTDGERPPEADQLRWVKLTYNLTAALAGSEGQRRDLFEQFLLKELAKGPDEVPWDALISAAEWERFPRDTLVRELLRDDSGFTTGELQLRSVLEKAFAVRGQTVDRELKDWWDPASLQKCRRLLHLSNLRPPLVSSPAELTHTLSWECLLAADAPLAGVLRAELNEGLLGDRLSDSVATLRAMLHDGVMAVLLDGLRRDALDRAWLECDPRRLQPEECIDLAKLLLQHLEQWSLLDPLPARLFECLGDGAEVPRDLIAVLEHAIDGLPPSTAPVTFLQLADMVLGLTDSVVLRQRLWQTLDGLEPGPSQRDLLGRILAGEWRYISARDLITADGSLRPRWAKTMAARLLNDARIAEVLSTATLVDLGGALTSTNQAALDSWHRWVHARMQTDPELTTDSLIHGRAWLAWRSEQGEGMRAAERRQAAMRWMCSPAFSTLRSGTAVDLPPQWSVDGSAAKHRAETTYETWTTVLEDLVELRTDEIAKLCARNTHFPWIHPLQSKQLVDLAARCADLDGLILLSRATEQTGFPAAGARPALWRYSRFASIAPEICLDWLLDGQASGLPNVSQSTRVLESVGVATRDHALRMHVMTVLATLDRDADVALDAADAAELWSQRGFRQGLVSWLRAVVVRGSFDADLIHQIDLRLAQQPGAAPAGLATVDAELARAAEQLNQRGYRNIAELLYPGIGRRTEQRAWITHAIEALASGSDRDPALAEISRRCQQQVELGVRDAKHHPLIVLAKEIHTRRRPPAGDALSEHGWHTFQRAFGATPALFDWAAKSDGTKVLPVFHLILAMNQHHSLHKTAVELAYFAPLDVLRRSSDWWEALIGSMHVYRSRPDAYFVAALAGLEQLIEDLPPEEAHALEKTWHRLAIPQLLNGDPGDLDR